MRDPLTRLLNVLRGSWLRQGVWSVVDQGLFAGANFVVNVLLARWLAPDAYGAFTVAFVVFLLAGTIHGGMLIEPMLVFGRGRFEGRTVAYLRVLLRYHAGYAVASGLLLGAVGAVAWAMGHGGFAVLFGTLALAQGAILLLWLMRRACYLVSRPAWAAAAGLVYLGLLTSSAVGLYRVDLLTGASALALMAVASLVASGLLAVRLGVFRAGRVDGLAAEARAAHLEYGRWSASTGVLEWGQLALPFLALPLFVGLEGSGTLRALYNLAMPSVQGFGALATLCLPLLVRARADGVFRPTLRALVGGFAALGTAYGLLVIAFGGPIVDWLYDGTYQASLGSLVFLGLIPVTVALANVLASAVRSAELPSAVFRARVWALGVAATVVLALTAAFGVVGALAGEVAMLVTEIGALWGPARRVGQEAPETAAPPVAPPEPSGDGTWALADPGPAAVPAAPPA